MDNPFRNYLLVEKEGGVFVPQTYEPHVEIEVKIDGTIDAGIGRQWDYLLLKEDLRTMANGDIKLVNIESFLQEGVLALCMKTFLAEIATNNKYGVLEVRQKDAVKEYIVDSNDIYILKHKGRSNFVLLEKEATPKGINRYQMEKNAYQATEIDSLGYIMADKPYLVIGEASRGTTFGLNSWKNNRHTKDVFERLFNPLQTLFSDHQLVYTILTRDEAIWFENKKLKGGAENIYQALKERGIDTIFIPTPATTPTLEELAGSTHERIQIIKGQINQRLI